jgi:hypothetical protein
MTNLIWTKTFAGAGLLLGYFYFKWKKITAALRVAYLANAGS